MTAALAAFIACIAALLVGAVASAQFAWHPAVTGPMAVAAAVGLAGSAVWLNWAAGRGGPGDGEGMS